MSSYCKGYAMIVWHPQSPPGWEGVAVVKEGERQRFSGRNHATISEGRFYQ